MSIGKLCDLISSRRAWEEAVHRGQNLKCTEDRL